MIIWGMLSLGRRYDVSFSYSSGLHVSVSAAHIISHIYFANLVTVILLRYKGFHCEFHLVSSFVPPWTMCFSLCLHCRRPIPPSCLVSHNYSSAGTDAHEFHHSVNMGCYGSKLSLWDWVFQTDGAYERWRMKRSEQSISNKSRIAQRTQWLSVNNPWKAASMNCECEWDSLGLHKKSYTLRFVLPFQLPPTYHRLLRDWDRAKKMTWHFMACTSPSLHHVLAANKSIVLLLNNVRCPREFSKAGHSRALHEAYLWSHSQVTSGEVL